MKNKLAFEIEVIQEKQFKSNKRIIQALNELAAPSYEDHRKLLEREIQLCNCLYLAIKPDGDIIGFFMVAWEEVLLQEKKLPAVYLGLSAASEATKGLGIGRALYNRFLIDAQLWEQHNLERLLLWHTTVSPAVFHSINQVFEDNEPYEDGTFSHKGLEIALALRNKMGWALPEAHQHPFVLRGVAKETRYSSVERDRINKMIFKYDFNLFSKLGIDETKGDRLLRISRVPKQQKVAVS